MCSGKDSFAELQERTTFALAFRDIAEARAAIKAMKAFVAMAEQDLEKLSAWRRSVLGEIEEAPKGI